MIEAPSEMLKAKALAGKLVAKGWVDVPDQVSSFLTDTNSTDFGGFMDECQERYLHLLTRDGFIGSREAVAFGAVMTAMIVAMLVKIPGWSNVPTSVKDNINGPLRELSDAAKKFTKGN